MTGAAPEERSIPRAGWLLAIIGLGGLLRLYALSSQPPSGDDAGVLLSALNYMELGQLGPTMWNHPGLRNILAYLMMQLLGTGVAGTLSLNVVLGILCIPLVHAVALRLTGERRVALVAALLYAVEPLAVEYSRQSINDIYLVFFPLAAILAIYRYLDSERPGWLVLAGVLFGLGLASKWSAVFQLAVMGGLLLFRVLRARGGQGSGALWARSLFTVATLVVLPLTIYLATFYPWFGRGYSLSEWPALQKSMYRETKLHTGYKQAIFGDHRALEWFVRPGVSHEDFIFTLPPGELKVEPSLRENLTVLMAVANPLVWLAVVPALLLLIRRAWRERSEGLGVLAALLLCSYLPLALVRRPVWFNTGVVVLPFVVMVVAHALCRPYAAARARWQAGAATAFLALACLVSLCLYPVAIGKGFTLPLGIGEYLMERAKNIQGVDKGSYGRDE
jgi:dolichyl-phosphate-mannose-protein mannosyltransferase